MSSRATASRVLYVEGRDDEHAIRQLLFRHGVDRRAPLDIVDAGGKPEVIRAIRTASRGRQIARKIAGFVLDANDDPRGTWMSVASHLRRAGFQAPDRISADGFVGEAVRGGTRVGVWLMPDNRRTGALEDFLEDLVEEGDRLYAHATQAADRAKRLGAQFSDVDALKARLHTWLAWQKRPGCPYGVAIRAHYLRADSDAAHRFVAWCARLFGAAIAGP